MANGKFSFMDIMNAQSKQVAAGDIIDTYTEVYLDPREVIPSESNFYSQDNIQELADTFLAVGQQQPTVLGRINSEYRIISGHRRNLANIYLLEQGHEMYKSVRYLYRDMSEAIFELSLLVGNAFNRELTAYEKTEQITRLKSALIRARDEDGLEIKGKLRDVVADLLGESVTNVARMDSINHNLTDEAKEQFKAGTIGITAAYETSKLSEDEQKEIAERAAAGEDIRAKEIAEKVAEKKASEYNAPHPESITSLCYSCLHYSTCNVKTGTCQKCDEYVNKAESEKTEEQRYYEEQDKIDRETARKLKEKVQEEKMNNLPSKSETETKVHQIRLASMYFDDVQCGKKRFELRKNDREYKVGDKLIMMEFANGKHTGREVEADVIYMLEDYSGIEEGYCILGIEVSVTDSHTGGQNE